MLHGYAYVCHSLEQSLAVGNVDMARGVFASVHLPQTPQVAGSTP